MAELATPTRPAPALAIEGLTYAYPAAVTRPADFWGPIATQKSAARSATSR